METEITIESTVSFTNIKSREIQRIVNQHIPIESLTLGDNHIPEIEIPDLVKPPTKEPVMEQIAEEDEETDE